MKSITDINFYKEEYTIKNNTVKTLNSLLQGEQMGVESFNTLINKVHNPNLKKSFQSMQKDHREHSALLAKRIQDLGGKADENLGFKGFMSDAMLSMDITSNDSDKHILDKAYEGVDKGVKMAEETARGDLDIQSRSLVEEILSTDKRHLSMMDELKNKIQ